MTPLPRRSVPTSAHPPNMQLRWGGCYSGGGVTPLSGSQSAAAAAPPLSLRSSSSRGVGVCAVWMSSCVCVCVVCCVWGRGGVGRGYRDFKVPTKLKLFIRSNFREMCRNTPNEVAASHLWSSSVSSPPLMSHPGTHPPLPLRERSATQQRLIEHHSGTEC